MIILLKKFGNTLISRQAGKEAFSAFLPSLRDIGGNEKVEVEFNGVVTFSPSWGDEFLRPLYELYTDRLILKVTENLSVKATIDILEKTNNIKFQVVN